MTSSFHGPDDLNRLANLLARRNELDDAIARLTGRPATLGHLGEFIASRVFGIELEASAVAKAIDGRFTDGPLAGRTVNIKCYSVQQGILDLIPESGPDYYLVLTGPRTKAMTSRGAIRPFVIESVHLFEAAPLLATLRERGTQIGTASSVRTGEWVKSMVYPKALNPAISLSEAQQMLLKLFARQ